MTRDEFKNRMYKDYISTHFGVGREEIQNDYEKYYRYYNINYSKFIPESTDTKILEIGCGMGHFLYYLQKKEYLNYLGIDISEENISFCKSHKFPVEYVDAFDFLKSNQEPFDIIIMNDIIEHLNKEEILKILDLMIRNINENGTVIIKTINSSNPILASSGRYIDFTHEISFTEESLSQVLKVCGFNDVRIYPQDIYIFYTNPFNYIAKYISKLLYFIFKMLFLMHGRNTKIFTKSIIAVGFKK